MINGLSILTPDKMIQAQMDAALLRNGELGIWSSETYDRYPQGQIGVFCHRHGFYGLPTIELVLFLSERINGRSAIEIGAGNGVLGKALGITCTDSMLQTRADIREYYAATGQPTITYGEHVEQMEGLHAVRHHRPKVVIGQWVTQWVPMEIRGPIDGSAWGIQEDKILEQVEEYIVIGHESLHGTKAIMPRVAEVLRPPWLRSRSQRPGNVIFIWKGARAG